MVSYLRLKRARRNDDGSAICTSYGTGLFVSSKIPHQIRGNMSLFTNKLYLGVCWPRLGTAGGNILMVLKYERCDATLYTLYNRQVHL